MFVRIRAIPKVNEFWHHFVSERRGSETIDLVRGTNIYATLRTFEHGEIFILSSFSVDYIIIKLYSKKTIYYHPETYFSETLLIDARVTFYSKFCRINEHKPNIDLKSLHPLTHPAII